MDQAEIDSYESDDSEEIMCSSRDPFTSSNLTDDQAPRFNMSIVEQDVSQSMTRPNGSLKKSRPDIIEEEEEPESSINYGQPQQLHLS